MFAGIGDDDTPSQTATATTTNDNSKKPTPTSTEADEDDPLAELANLAVAPRLSTSSRPSTPARSVRTRSPGRRADLNTPTTNSGRSSEEKAPLYVEQEQKSYAASATPTTQHVPAQQGGGWWGGLSGIASAAFKQAEAAVKEIQKTEEAQKWAEQVKDNYGALKGFGASALLLPPPSSN